jgi:type IX secretion system PorP/SprF family membrane protein
MMKKLLTLVFILIHSIGFSQVDPHLSQYYVYPSWLNPALTGAFDGDYRISGVYRNQWGAVTDGFNTVGLSADMVTNKNLNFGASIMQQSTGTGYSYMLAHASAAYTGLKFDANGYQRLVFGLQVGLINRNFDASKFQLGDQWNNGTGFMPGAGSMENFTGLNANVLDIGAGAVYYDSDPAKKANLFLGFSMMHINQPRSNFYSQTANDKLPARYTLHGGVRLAITESVSVVPNALYLRQGNAEAKMIGGYVQFNGPVDTDILFGANYRFNDAIVPFLGLNVKSLVFGFSYDLNNSDLGRNISNANSLEFSLSYVIRKSKTLGEKNFICPRF